MILPHPSLLSLGFSPFSSGLWFCFLFWYATVSFCFSFFSLLFQIEAFFGSCSRIFLTFGSSQNIPRTVLVFRIQELKYFFHRPHTGFFVLAQVEARDYLIKLIWWVGCVTCDLCSGHPWLSVLPLNSESAWLPAFSPASAMASPLIKWHLPITFTTDFLKIVRE